MTVGASRWLVGAGWCALWLLAFQAGCSGGSGQSASCTARCSDICKAFEACGAVPADCEAQCTLGLGSNCSGPRPDQLTCDELSSTYACADYCATLCTRAPDCGSFDQGACARGCASQYHAICNPRSVAARSCDQLKPELRLYDEAGNAGPNEEVVGNIGSGARYGLCETAADCTAPDGCSSNTNTCGPCRTDAACENGIFAHACMAGACVKVDCLKDADCYGGDFCETTLHVCGDCHSAADCTSSFRPICSATSATCIGCEVNADCKDQFAPTCSPTLHACTPCNSDADCAGHAGTPFCGEGCVECRTSADCKAPAECTATGRCI